MKKVFASDFDGTLYFGKREVKLPAESVRKIQAFQEAGHLFGLCTGRPLGGLTPILEGVIRPDFYICSSGSNVVDGHADEIQKRGIDRDTVLSICNLYQSRGCRVMACVDDQICVFHAVEIPVLVRILGSADELPEGTIYQVSIHAKTPEEAFAVAAHINETYGEKVSAFQNVNDIDIAPAGCSKGTGMELIRRHYAREQCSAKELYRSGQNRQGREESGQGQECNEIMLFGIGDSYNDLPMMEAADVSYTFPYAPKEVQERATRVVETIVDALEDCMRYSTEL